MGTSKINYNWKNNIYKQWMPKTLKNKNKEVKF